MRVFIEDIKTAKRELAKVYRELKGNLLEREDAKARVYVLRAIIEANFKYELEKRITDLEEKAGLR